MIINIITNNQSLNHHNPNNHSLAKNQFNSISKKNSNNFKENQMLLLILITNYKMQKVSKSILPS